MDIVDDKEWTVVTKGYCPKVNETSKIVTTNNYSILTPANKLTIMDTTPPPTITPTTYSPNNSSKKMNKHQRRASIRQHRRAVLQKLNKSEELFLDTAITQAEDEQTTMANSTSMMPNKQQLTLHMHGQINHA
jgi:hypothetical protein